jgi:hypothetical protein
MSRADLGLAIMWTGFGVFLSRCFIAFGATDYALLLIGGAGVFSGAVMALRWGLK